MEYKTSIDLLKLVTNAVAWEQTRNAQPTYNVDWRSARQHTSSPTIETSRLGFGSKPALKS